MRYLYVISYDLRKPGRDYDPLYDALEQEGAERILQSQWALKIGLPGQAKVLRAEFKRFIDNNDRLLVTEVDDWAGRKLKFSPNDL